LFVGRTPIFPQLAVAELARTLAGERAHELWREVAARVRAEIMPPADGVYDWTLHDCRRTLRSRLADLHSAVVDSDTAEAILAHGRRGIGANYNGSEFIFKKRVALDMWQDLLLDIVKRNNSWAQALKSWGLVKR
jgi:hypothetical protein